MTIDFEANPLVPAIAQDANTGQVLMLAYMNKEALERTLDSGDAWFWSRSRQELWHKGETSGNFLRVRSAAADCDGDTVLLRVDPAGPACHTGAVSCFFDQLKTEDNADRMPALPGPARPGPDAVNVLFGTILDRKKRQPEGSYVAGLLAAGKERVAKKVLEEAGEAAIASLTEEDQRVVEEVADLWFHSLVLLASRDLTPAQVWQELERRRR